MNHKIIFATLAACITLFGCKKESPTTEPTTLNAPTLSSSSITASGFTVEWENVENASAYAYTLLSSANGAMDTITSEDNYTGTSVTFTDLDANTEYEVRVKALGTDDNLYLDSKEASITVTTLAPEIDRTTFDAPALAQKLGSGFEAFCSEFAGYKADGQSEEDLFAMYAEVNVEGNAIPVIVKVEEDVYGNVGSLTATPENSEDDKTLWNYYLNNYESLGLGQWLGAKYSTYLEDGTSEGGVYQTVEEALNLVSGSDVDKILINAIFGVIPGKAYAVPSFENGRFIFQIVNNFFRLDYSAMYSLIGSDYNAFAEENRLIGFKMSMFGEYYFYIDYALDMNGNAFTCDFNADAEVSKIRDINIYGPENTDEQLRIWKEYAAGTESLNLGEFKEAYTSSFGSKITTFSSAQEALDYVNSNGRPTGGFDPDVVLVFGNESTSLTITLKSLDLQMSITPATAS